MKRYVKEYANAVKEYLKRWYPNDPTAKLCIEKIDRYVNLCERNFVSNFETIEKITQFRHGNLNSNTSTD